jgi:hypothetical protein
MSLRVKLLLGFLIVLVLAGGEGYFAVQTINSTGQLAMDIYDRQLMAISFSKSAMIEFNKMNRLLAESLTGGEIDDKEELLEELEVAATRLATPEAMKVDEEIKAGLGVWWSRTTALIESKDGAKAVPPPEDLTDITSTINEEIEGLVDHATERGYVAREAAASSIKVAEQTNQIGIGIFSIICLMIAYWLGVAISKPINRTKTAMRDLADGIDAGGDALRQLDDVPYTDRRDGRLGPGIQGNRDAGREASGRYEGP